MERKKKKGNAKRRGKMKDYLEKKEGRVTEREINNSISAIKEQVFLNTL